MAEICGAKTRRGTPCERQPGWGTEHVGVGRCRHHGGSSPQAQLSGTVELARREWAVMGMPLSIEPQDAILECIRIASGEVRYASDRIAELAEAEAVGPVLTSKLELAPREDAESDTDLDKDSNQAPEPVAELRFGPPAGHIWIVMRRQAMDRLVSYSERALRAGVQERLVRVAESQAQLLAEAVRGILTDLGVQDHPEAPAIVRRHLTLLSRATAA